VICFCDVPAEINSGPSPSGVVKMITRRHKETVTPFPPFGASSIERTGLNVFATPGRVSTVFVGGDHGQIYRLTGSYGAVRQIGQGGRVDATPMCGLITSASRMSFSLGPVFGQNFQCVLAERRPF
jgi:hypothetical protein